MAVQLGWQCGGCVVPFDPAGVLRIQLDVIAEQTLGLPREPR
ncbi:hypothetical protein AB4Z09_00700 [Rhodococcus sp. TAF43]|nr:hypothetical protein [Rhodococcus sp. AG1013]